VFDGLGGVYVDGNDDQLDRSNARGGGELRVSAHLAYVLLLSVMVWIERPDMLKESGGAQAMFACDSSNKLILLIYFRSIK
jgi:hypothetical protein